MGSGRTEIADIGILVEVFDEVCAVVVFVERSGRTEIADLEIVAVEYV